MFSFDIKFGQLQLLHTQLTMVPDISPEEQQKVSAQFRTLREELEALYNELATVDGDRSEHEYVGQEHRTTNHRLACMTFLFVICLGVY